MSKYVLGAGVAIGFVVLAGGLTVVSQESFGLKQVLAKLLTKQELVSTVASGSSSVDHKALYVLGGAGDSLIRRFAKAAELYKQGLANRVLIKSDEMLMEYSPSAGRNLSHDEWAAGKLVGLGVKEKDVEFIVVESVLWGTFSEARTLANVVSHRGYKSLILVSSDYHTARVWYSFSKLMRGQNVSLYIYPAKDDPTTCGLLHEFLKFSFYRAFL